MTQLKRVVGLPGAVLLGLGSILGTGVFVSLSIGANVSGAWVLPALAVAACLATFNGLSSAQLAAAHPTSGGTYEYGYRFLRPAWGFSAGWMFLLAKSASAATAALGAAAYLIRVALLDPRWETPIALGLVFGMTALVAGGMRRSNVINAGLVGFTLFALASFAFKAIPAGRPVHLGPFAPAAFFETCALMFVAFTGYGRIATLGEEVRDPARTIPAAVIVTLAAAAAVYLAVAWGALAVHGPRLFGAFSEMQGAPLVRVAADLRSPRLASNVAVAAVAAMAGVLLNLLLGLSRVVLAMARRGDMPARFAAVSPGGSPVRAVGAVGLLIAGLTLIGNVKTTWSFSAFTVLVYYAITNLAALRMPDELRRFPKWVAQAGLGACVFLAFWVDARIWAAGLLLLAAGLVIHAWRRR